jgi:hypothetical protein
LIDPNASGVGGGWMILGLLKRLFGCQHRRISRPITPAPGPDSPADMYVVCLDCGQHFAYDWKEMKVGKRIEQPPPRTW